MLHATSPNHLFCSMFTLKVIREDAIKLNFLIWQNKILLMLLWQSPESFGAPKSIHVNPQVRGRLHFGDESWWFSKIDIKFPHFEQCQQSRALHRRALHTYFSFILIPTFCDPQAKTQEQLEHNISSFGTLLVQQPNGLVVLQLSAYLPSYRFKSRCRHFTKFSFFRERFWVVFK